MRNIVAMMLLFLVGVAVSCKQKPAEDTAQSAARSAKHYQVKGKVVSVDKQSRMLNLDSEAIPGFMDAMTMPYSVRPESELDKLNPGDAITADLTVQDDQAWLENIRVIGHRSPGSPN
jgi:protein SCO1/2